MFTRKEAVDPHTMCLFSVNGERQAMEEYSVVLFITPYIQQVPSDLLVLGDHQTGKCLRHVTVYC